MPNDEQNQDDKFGPEAMAARVDSLGEETEADRLAREEENKLLERRKQKKTGLEAAASKRLAKIGETAVKRPTTALPADPFTDRAAAIGKWVQHHRNTFAALVGTVVICVAGLAAWWAWQDRRTGEASLLLGQAYAAEHGRIVSKDEDDDDSASATTRQLYPAFKNAADKREAALAKYRRLETAYSGTGAAIVARLSEAGLLYDAGDVKGARAAYEEVAASPLAKADPEVRGRALEGKGFADELLADKDPDNGPKHLDDAMAAYRAVEAVDVDGFKELGLYHQARLAVIRSDKAKAVELFKDVTKRVEQGTDSQAFAYLQFRAQDRLRELDPSALPPKAPPPGPGAGVGGPEMSDPKIQELIRQMQEKARTGSGTPAAPVPPAPSSP